MGGAREPSPLMETKCSSNRSPVPASPWRELMRALDAGPAVILLAAPPALAPRGNICNLFNFELAHHLYDVLEGLLVFQAVRSRGGATHALTCKFEPYTLTRGAIEPHRIYGDKILVAQLKILE